MNKAILLSFLLTIPLFSQTDSYTLLELENSAKINTAAIPGYNLMPQVQEKSKKSIGLAILYSLLLPGMGELYGGNYSTGKYFTIAEGVLWGSYIGINTYGNWMKDRYTAYAETNGGITAAGKDENYYAVIGEYRNIEQYNDDKAFNRNFDEMYDEGSHFWKWNTEQERRSYRNMWVSSEQAYNNLRFVAGALIINRLISAINAVRVTAAYNKSLQSEIGWNVSFGLTDCHPGIPTGLSLNFSTQF